MKAGGYSRPLTGYTVCGDNHVVARTADAVVTAVIDGLGHGYDSALAANRAVEVIQASAELSAHAIVMRCHEALRATRGAAIGLLRLAADGSGEFCGIGNVEVQALAGRPPSVFCLAGIVGHNLRTARAMPVQMAPGDIYCLLSDGIQTRANLRSCLPGTARSVAQRIVEQWGRPHDDATALVVGYGPGSLLDEQP
jgi:hypothetical protein